MCQFTRQYNHATMSNSQQMSRQSFPRRATIVVVFAVLVAIMMSILTRFEDWKRALTVNYAEIDSVLVSQSPADVAASIQQWVDGQSSWSLRSRKEISGGIEMHLTRTTRVMRFVDDIRVRLFVDGDRTRIDAASQSRFGKGDLGQNRRNLRELLAEFDDQILSRGSFGHDR